MNHLNIQTVVYIALPNRFRPVPPCCDESPTGNLLDRYLPKGFIHVVNQIYSSERGICQNPLICIYHTKNLCPIYVIDWKGSSASNQHIVLFSCFSFGVITLGVHHFYGLEADSITPFLHIAQISCFSAFFKGKGTRPPMLIT